MQANQDIFVRLMLPFEDWEVRALQKKSKHTDQVTELLYVSATTVLNRLDDVVGPQNWTAQYTQLARGVQCRLTITLPSGEVIIREECGGYHGMADGGDDEKSGFSDAIKRAAMALGVGRYLWRNGVPEFAREAFERSIQERRLAHCGYKAPAQAAPTPQALPKPKAEPTETNVVTSQDLLYLLRNETSAIGFDLTAYITKQWATDKGWGPVVTRWTPDQLTLGMKEAKRKAAVIRRSNGQLVA
jgi:hypothetical protein